MDTSRGFAATSTSRDVARNNRAVVLEQLAAGEVLSRVQVSELTGLSPATISRLTPVLVESGLVVEAGPDGQTGGRPSQMFRFDPDARNILAADISGDSLEIAEVNLDGRIRRREVTDVSQLSPNEKLDALVAGVSRWVQSRPQDRSYVAVGVSVPGPVDSDGTVSVAPALDWFNVPVLGALRECGLGGAIVENDANLVAYAESKQGRWAGTESLAAIGVFEGVGAGIVENGRLWRGRGGAAAQFGRMLTGTSGLGRAAADFGQMESSLGSGAIASRAAQRGLVPSTGATADDVFRKAAMRDPDAVAFLNEIADEYAVHLANLCAIVAPDTVVFAGLFERWPAPILSLISDRLREAVLDAPVLVRAAAGRDAKLIGAALYAFDRVGGWGSLV